MVREASPALLARVTPRKRSIWARYPDCVWREAGRVKIWRHFAHLDDPMNGHLIDFLTVLMVVSRGFKFCPVWCPLWSKSPGAERAELAKTFSCSLADLVRRWSFRLRSSGSGFRVARLIPSMTLLQSGSAGQFFCCGKFEAAGS